MGPLPTMGASGGEGGGASGLGGQSVTGSGGTEPQCLAGAGGTCNAPVVCETPLGVPQRLPFSEVANELGRLLGLEAQLFAQDSVPSSALTDVGDRFNAETLEHVEVMVGAALNWAFTDVAAGCTEPISDAEVAPYSECAKQLIADFASSAFRGQATAETLQSLEGVYDDTLLISADPREATYYTLYATLLAPQFLYALTPCTELPNGVISEETP
jgi:hypothetical protein